MKTLVTALGVLALGGALSAQTFKFTMDGGQEVPPVPTTGSGECTVTLNPATGDVSVNGTYTNLTTAATAAHIHGPAPAGMSAGILVPLSVTGGTSGSVFGQGVLTQAQVNDMLAGLHYVNVHSSAFTGGEIRGQIVAEGTVTPYGGNPPGSLTLLGGQPLLATMLTLGVDNPLGTQPAGSVPVVAISTLPDPTYALTGTGTMVPGWGMAGGAGELLIAVGGVNPLFALSGAVWSGPGTPAPVNLTVPNQLVLIGVTVYAQGILVNPFGPGPGLGVTNGLEITIGI